jgi:hypothetical protein
MPSMAGKVEFGPSNTGRTARSRKTAQWFADFSTGDRGSDDYRQARFKSCRIQSFALVCLHAKITPLQTIGVRCRISVAGENVPTNSVAVMAEIGGECLLNGFDVTLQAPIWRATRIYRERNARSEGLRRGR